LLAASHGTDSGSNLHTASVAIQFKTTTRKKEEKKEKGPFVAL